MPNEKPKRFNPAKADKPLLIPVKGTSGDLDNNLKDKDKTKFKAVASRDEASKPSETRDSDRTTRCRPVNPVSTFSDSGTLYYKI